MLYEVQFDPTYKYSIYVRESVIRLCLELGLTVYNYAGNFVVGELDRKSADALAALLGEAGAKGVRICYDSSSERKGWKKPVSMASPLSHL